MVGPNSALAIAAVSGAGGTGRTTASKSLAQLLGQRKKVLLFDLCFGWGGLAINADNLPGYDELLNLDKDQDDLIIHSMSGYDILTCEPPEFLDPTLDDLKKIAWLANELGYDYDCIVFDPPSGAHPLALLASGLSEQVLLFSRPDAAAIAASYCLLKSLYAEGIYSRVKTVFAQVESAEQAASLKTRFDIMTTQFLKFTIADGGFIYRQELNGDDFQFIEEDEQMPEIAKNIRINDSAMLQNATGQTQSGIGFPNAIKVRR